MTKAYHIVFDGFPSPDGPRFIELENDDGKSINAGEWKDRADGLTELVLPITPPPTHSLTVGYGLFVDDKMLAWTDEEGFAKANWNPNMVRPIYAGHLRDSTSVGWLYDNEDTGREFSENHPIESGEVPDATNIAPATAEALLSDLKLSWGNQAPLQRDAE